MSGCVCLWVGVGVGVTQLKEFVVAWSAWRVARLRACVGCEGWGEVGAGGRWVGGEAGWGGC